MIKSLKSHLDYDGTVFYSNYLNLKKAVQHDDVQYNCTYLSPTMSYQRYAVQGFLKKDAKETKLFQRKSIYKRYFVLDHNAKKMRIHKTNDPMSEYKLYNYQDI